MDSATSTICATASTSTSSRRWSCSRRPASSPPSPQTPPTEPSPWSAPSARASRPSACSSPTSSSAARQVAAAPPGESLPIYRLPELYAYVEATLGPGLFGRARARRWAELVEARALLAAEPQLLVQTLTAVGTLGAIERSSGLRASRAQVAFALADDPDDRATAEALRTLQARSHLTYRQHRDSYLLWEGSDLDLDAMALAARRERGERAALPQLMQRHADSTPRIARRHS